MTSERAPGGYRGAFVAYNAALAATSPMLLGWYGWRVLGSGKSREGWLERLGFPAGSQKGIVPRSNIWMHAVSVGEVTAAAPVVREYQQLPEPYGVEMSTITSTGRQMADRLLPEVPKLFLPVDLLPPVRAVVRRVRPLCLALCEKELWPNLLNEAKRCGAKVALINGVVSDRTVERAQRVGLIYQWTLSNIDRFLMQTQEDAEKIVRLGADESRVEVSGNTKFDEADEPLTTKEALDVAESMGLDPLAPVFVAGSTNPGEDEVVLAAFRAAKSRTPALRLVIAPRQIERAGEIQDLASGYGYSSVKRSEVQSRHEADVVVLNTFGELAKAYAMAVVAFVGGTFINKGGHNILQPLAQGVPVTFGPYDQNIRGIAAKAVGAGVAYRAETPEALAHAVRDLAAGHDQLQYRERALKLIQENRGASRKCAQTLHELARSAAS